MSSAEKYNDVLEQLEIDIAPLDPILPIDDHSLLEAIEKEQSDSDPEYVRRNCLYSDLLEQYIESYRSKAKWKKWFKLAFFIVTMLCFIGIIVVSLIALIFVAQKSKTDIADIGTVLGSVSGVISALVVLPKIIASHLFSTDEDSNMINMVKNMQLNDSGIRKNSKK